MDNLISVIIVNYNGKKWIENLFNSLLLQTYKNFEVIFVDNASIDDSIDFLKDNYKDNRIKIIKSDKNLGFAGGNNLGINNSKGKYILLLNNDAWVEEKFVEKLFGNLVNGNYDILAPQEKNYFLESYNFFNEKTIDFFGHPAISKNKKRFYLSGACLIFPRKLYQETQGMDGDFFMYFEETDWFWRLNLLNKKNDIAEEVSFYHFGSGSTGEGIKYKKFIWRNRNTLQMLLKNYKWFNLLWLLPIYFVQNILEIIFFLIILKPEISFSYIDGWIFNIINIKKIIKKRKWIQKNRIISDFEIMKKMYIGFAKIGHLRYFMQNK